MMKKQQQSGFTLVEIAIVLVIVGLLLGGVLKGQEIINSAKAKAVINDFRNTATMMAAYQDRYRALPGDDPNAEITFGSNVTKKGNGDGRIDGDWNSESSADESVRFWQHLRLANLASGNTAAPADSTINNWVPRNSEGGRIGITTAIGATADQRPTGLDPRINGRHFICQSNLDGRIAQQVDTALDDGNGTTGSVGIIAESNAGVAGGPASVPVAGQTYTVCYGI